jgi:hypothetical protein
VINPSIHPLTSAHTHANTRTRTLTNSFFFIVFVRSLFILPFPFSFYKYFLFTYVASAFITAISAYAYYTAILLINLQEKGQGTYSELTDSIMGDGFSKCTVRPAQLLNFFPTTAVMILIGGQSLATIDALDGVQNVSDEWWLVIVSFL